MLKNVTFDTSLFEFAHGKKPSGRGTWSFCPAQYADRDNYLAYTKSMAGLYSDAKRAAAEHFGAEFYSVRVVVLS